MPAYPHNSQITRILSSMPAAVAVLEGPLHMIRYHNREFIELAGSPTTVVGLTANAAFPDVIAQGFGELLDTVYATGVPYVGTEVEVELPDRTTGASQTRFVNYAYIPRRDDAGAVDGIIVHAIDVTDHVEARGRNEALAASLEVERQRLSDVIEELRAGVAIADADGRLLYANRSWRDVFEFEAEAVVDVAGIADYDVFVGYRMDGSRYEVAEYPISRALLNGEQVTDRIRFEFESGRERIVDVSARRITGVEGDPVAAMVTTIDMTDELALQEQAVLQRERDLLRRADAERRRAYEVNDTVVQRLAVADLALDLGEADVARGALREALAITKRLISEWGAKADDLSLSAEQLELAND